MAWLYGLTSLSVACLAGPLLQAQQPHLLLAHRCLRAFWRQGACAAGVPQGAAGGLQYRDPGGRTASVYWWGAGDKELRMYCKALWEAAVQRDGWGMLCGQAFRRFFMEGQVVISLSSECLRSFI